MISLKRVSHPILTDNVHKLLHNSHITTIIDLLNEDVEKISIITKLSLAQVLSLRTHICIQYSAPVINGIELLERHKSRSLLLSTGLTSLDDELHGGLPIGHVVEICGLAGSGKTQLCFQLAINIVINTNKLVLYIDTKGDFSAMRIQQMLQANCINIKEMAEIMFQIKVIHAWSMDQLVEVLQMIKNNLQNFNNLALIVIDSLPSLMFQYLGDINKIGLVMLNKCVNYCRYLCNQLQICVVCVNIQTRWIDQDVSDLEDDKELYTSTLKESVYVEKQNRCLGKYWQQIPNLILLLKRKDQDNEPDHSQVKINVMNSRGIQNTYCNLILNVKGFVC